MINGEDRILTGKLASRIIIFCALAATRSLSTTAQRENWKISPLKTLFTGFALLGVWNSRNILNKASRSRSN
ncbi:hypothetical protein D910_08683 [Dendroctonus ponderosae]